MKVISKVMLAVMLLTITGCTQVKRVPKNNNLSIIGSGNVVSQTHPLSDFDTLEAGLTFDLSIRHGEEFSVVLVADDNLVDYLATEKTGTTLSFDLKPGYAYNISNVTMRAEVTMPELAGLNLNGSSRAVLSGFPSVENFEAELTGSSSLTGGLEADTARLDVYGDAYVKLAGSGKNLWIDACGNSVIDLSDFHAEDAMLDVSCASTAVVRVDARLDVDASQNSRVYYVGQPATSNIQVYQHASVEPQR